MKDRLKWIGDKRAECLRCGFQMHCPNSLDKCMCVCEGRVPPPLDGPGTEFHLLVQSFGILSNCSGCAALMHDMNRWGPDGCRERKYEILSRMVEHEKNLGWGEWLKAGSSAALSGYRSKWAVVEEAIRRAEKRANF